METFSNDEYHASRKSRHREVPWLYLMPVAGAPIAHVLVSATNMAHSKQVKSLLWGGVVLSTVTMVINRLWLLDDAWDDSELRYLDPDQKNRPYV